MSWAALWRKPHEEELRRASNCARNWSLSHSLSCDAANSHVTLKRIFFPSRNSKWDCSPGQHLGWSFQMRLWSGEPSKVRPRLLVQRIMVCVLNRVPLFATPPGSSVHEIFQARILEQNCDTIKICCFKLLSFLLIVTQGYVAGYMLIYHETKFSWKPKPSWNSENTHPLSFVGGLDIKVIF